MDHFANFSCFDDDSTRSGHLKVRKRCPTGQKPVPHYHVIQVITTIASRAWSSLFYLLLYYFWKKSRASSWTWEVFFNSLMLFLILLWWKMIVWGAWDVDLTSLTKRKCFIDSKNWFDSKFLDVKLLFAKCILSIIFKILNFNMLLE